LNVVRTVQEHERAGTAGIHIEDQVSPKRCGHLEGKQLVSTEEFLAKIRAAVATRRDPDLVVIARTDARSVARVDEVIRRANLALEAGADLAFVESPETLEEVAMVPRRVSGPCVLNVVWGGKTPQVDLREAQMMGRLTGRVDYTQECLFTLMKLGGISAYCRDLAGPLAEDCLRRLRRRAGRAEGDASPPDAAL
jgi:2-methylisocitrate lyase-like PEP mutase family enzyme